MRTWIPALRLPCLLLPCLLTAGCTSVDTQLRNTVVLHYQHVANVQRIDFSTPVMLPGRGAPAHFVQPLESQGFWAVFVVCSVDATGAGIPSFYFDAERLRVQYGEQRYGPLRPYTVRLDDTTDLNTRRDTPVLAAAIAAEIGEGPQSQIFRHGFHPDLDIRVALYVPHALPDYSGDRLPLRYEGGQTLVLGNDYPPSSIPIAGLGGTGIASHCLP
ncbi:hypothetical protein QPK32_20170 [Massilia sp. YIM B02763]|uniref:hypothetical protein n=1 Tax=Massilia sp. YIM B02763 TaxID=3050130 RepID=UPI0025B657AA|nr:hypothetical protein [Massilia sp. YIM B02763]MDN4055390.1 hypothetical protein [Massilia sp. YIM B02763]